MQSKKRKQHKILFVLLALLLLVVAVISGRVFLPAYAQTTEYTDVLIDLQTDKNFNIANYPANGKDGSIQVIQVAESEDGELFIYTYQPCQKTVPLTATQLNMSLSESVNNTRLYDLTLLNSSGVFCKYKVNGFEVSASKVRYYNISTIYRPYDKAVDDSFLSNNKSIAFAVGQCWTAISMNKTVIYSMEMVDVITITNCFYGSIRVPEGFNMWASYACDMHIIAFSTDIKMDKLLEADVSFDYREVNDGWYDTGYGDWKSNTVTVNYKEKGASGDRIFGKSTPKTWDRIQDSEEFLTYLAIEGLLPSDEDMKAINKTDWVLAFWDTEFENENGGVAGAAFGWIGNLFGAKTKHYTEVSNATVIRLEFIKDGETYNLGVVSNKTGDFDIVGGGDETFGDTINDTVTGAFTSKLGGLPLWAWLLIAVAVIVIIFVLIKVWGKKNDRN